MVRAVRPEIANAYVPIYVGIREHVRELIASGELVVGARAPSESALAELFGTTRMTVRKALSELVFQGLIERSVGRGSFVRRPQVEMRLDTTALRSFEQHLAAQGAVPELRLLDFGPEPASARIAARLRVEEGAQVYRAEWLRCVDGAIVGLKTRLLPQRIGERIDRHQLARGALMALLEQVLGAPLSAVRVGLHATAATAAIAARLGAREGKPLLVREVTLLDRAGEPCCCGESFFVEEVRFSFEIPGAPAPTGEDPW